MGMGHGLTECTARDGAGDGVKLWGMHFRITGCVATNNAGDGLAGMGMDWQLAGNRADDNGGDGLHVYGYWLIDDGGNRGSGNRGTGKRTAAGAVRDRRAGVPAMRAPIVRRTRALASALGLLAAAIAARPAAAASLPACTAADIIAQDNSCPDRARGPAPSPRTSPSATAARSTSGRAPSP